VKIVEACLKLYYDKDHHTNGNTNSQTGNVDNSVIPVSDQTSECGFEIIFKHKQVVLSFKSIIKMPVYSVLAEHVCPELFRQKYFSRYLK
jgi:hypothetical protein